MKNNINYPYIKQKRVKSVIKTRNLLNLTKNNTINNNSVKNIYNSPYQDQLSKIDTQRLTTDYSIISPLSKEKIKFNQKQIFKKRVLSMNQKRNSKYFTEPESKKFLRGKLRLLIKNNIILCEKEFHPRNFTESITHKRIKEFKSRFKNLDSRNKVGIFTNKFPALLNNGNKFYTRYFDYFISPDELLNQNFNKEEIFQIKSDPVFFNFGPHFQNVKFFKRKTLKETLNEEEKIGQSKIIDFTMKKSLHQTKKKIGSYLNYYSSIISKQGFIKI